MKHLKSTVILLLAITFALSGCSLFVPDEYKDGVKVDRNYPDDDLPVYENAIVFSSVEDDGEITLTMGTKDELEDIVDFYQDFFDDEEIVLASEDEGKKDYSAEGHITDYDFTLDVAEPDDGDWQEKLFTNIIEIVVTPAENEPVIAADDYNQLIVGTWALKTAQLAGSDVTSNTWEYLICTYYEDGTGHEIYKWPYEAEVMERFTWQIVGTELTVTYEDQSSYTTAISSITDTVFTELAVGENELYDTLIYDKVANDSWRPENVTPEYDDSTSTYTDTPATLDQIYGAWVSYNYDYSFSLWSDGSGRLWTPDNTDGYFITWDYSDDGTLNLHPDDTTTTYSYFVTYDGEDLYIVSEDLGISQYMERQDYAITYIPWVMIYDSTDPDYESNSDLYLYFYSDNTYEVYDGTTVTESSTWRINESGALEFDNDPSYVFDINYEGGFLLMYNGTDYYWYQTQYDLQ